MGQPGDLTGSKNKGIRGICPKGIKKNTKEAQGKESTPKGEALLRYSPRSQKEIRRLGELTRASKKKRTRRGKSWGLEP